MWRVVLFSEAIVGRPSNECAKRQPCQDDSPRTCQLFTLNEAKGVRNPPIADNCPSNFFDFNLARNVFKGWEVCLLGDNVEGGVYHGYRLPLGYHWKAET